MSVFFAVLKGAYLKNFAYRISVIFSCLGSIIAVLAQIALWSYLYREDDAQATYMIAYVIIARLLSCMHNSDVAYNIEAKVRSGDLALDFIRPVKSSVVFWGEVCGNTAAALVLGGLPILLIFGFTFFQGNITLSGLLMFFPAVLMGFVLYSALYMIIGYIAFIAIMNWPYIRIANDTLRLLSGAVVPITLFPPFVQKLTWFLPFRLLYSFPINLLIGGMTQQEILADFLILGTWTLGMLLLLRAVEAGVEKRLTIQGG